MNFLGHLYLSDNKYDLMLANLFGDFVKGKDYSYLPLIVQKGVKLHREIDDFIDRHPLILEMLNDFLYKDLPKVAGIAIDLYMDHLLAKNWNQFHHIELREFEYRFFDYALNPSNQIFKTEKDTYSYPHEFIVLLEVMHKKSWLSHYQKLDGLRMASTGLSKRISFENNLNEAIEVYQKREKQIENVFFEFMKGAQIKFLDL
jgi:acyl carrier protein phosphodiesterase